MEQIVGIDLGTTNSLIGVMDAGIPILLAGADGARLTPSIVHFPAQGEPFAGSAAGRMRAIDSESTVYSVKRFVGLRGEDVADDERQVLPYRISRGTGPLRIKAGDREYSPEEISAVILKKLKQDAETALGHVVERAVITVPAYFNDAQRNATKRAGELAGLRVERIVNEPTAAALAYGLDRLKARARIGVYDLGGGTFDISLLELNDGVFEVLATNGNTRLGGDDIDAALLGRVRGRIKKGKPSPTMLARLRDALIAAKHRLSQESSVALELPFLDGQESFQFVLTRDELEEIARPIIERTRLHCQRVLADARLAASDLDALILVGGVTRMPLVQRFITEVFGRAPNLSQNPDEAVAMGATIQAGILSGAVREVILLDITPLSLGIETFGGLMNVIIPRNSTIPTKAGEMFTTAVSNQKAMTIKVLQGEREMARDNWKLGEFEIAFEAAPKGVPRVGVQFEIDVNGILHVLARDTKTGQEKIIEMQSAVDVSDEAVEAMLADSLEHAFEDVNERIWTETRLKSEEMLAAVEAALQLMGEEIDTAEQNRIRALAGAVRAALGARDVARLKKENQALDEATQTLAAIVIEKSMRMAG
jgi:molecular chaperone DnaK